MSHIYFCTHSFDEYEVAWKDGFSRVKIVYFFIILFLLFCKESNKKKIAVENKPYPIDYISLYRNVKLYKFPEKKVEFIIKSRGFINVYEDCKQIEGIDYCLHNSDENLWIEKKNLSEFVKIDKNNKIANFPINAFGESFEKLRIYDTNDMDDHKNIFFVIDKDGRERKLLTFEIGNNKKGFWWSHYLDEITDINSDGNDDFIFNVLEEYSQDLIIYISSDSGYRIFYLSEIVSKLTKKKMDISISELEGGQFDFGYNNKGNYFEIYKKGNFKEVLLKVQYNKNVWKIIK